MKIFGWTPLKTKRLMTKWTAVKDARCDIKIPDHADIVAKVDQYVNNLIEYRGEYIDVWSTPEETLARGYGDCEDMALLKRAILLNHGIEDKDIMFLIVNDLVTRQQHAILIVDGRALDNFNNLTLPVERVMDYVPLTACAADMGYIFGKAV